MGTPREGENEGQKDEGCKAQTEGVGLEKDVPLLCKSILHLGLGIWRVEKAPPNQRLCAARITPFSPQSIPKVTPVSRQTPPRVDCLSQVFKELTAGAIVAEVRR